MKMNLLFVLLLPVALLAAPRDTSIIYTEKHSQNYIPSGYMGDHGDIKINQRWKRNPAKGETCIQVRYSGEAKQGANWAGVYWQKPANNWGNKRGGLDLSKYKLLVFKARGEAGGEYIEKFFVGGISDREESGDSDEAYTDAIELTKEWQEYEIDLEGSDMSYIIGGFGFAMSLDYNEGGATFYLDEIKFK